MRSLPGHSPEAMTPATYWRKGTVSTLPVRVRKTRMLGGGTCVLVQPVHDDPAAAGLGLESCGTASRESVASAPIAIRVARPVIAERERRAAAGTR